MFTLWAFLVGLLSLAPALAPPEESYQTFPRRNPSKEPYQTRPIYYSTGEHNHKTTTGHAVVILRIYLDAIVSTTSMHMCYESATNLSEVWLATEFPSKCYEIY